MSPREPPGGQIVSSTVDNIDELIRKLDEEYPLVPHTGAGQLFSTVRRMKAEREMRIPVAMRTGFAISINEKKPANELTEGKWEEFYTALCKELKSRYPSLYKQLFPQRQHSD